MSAGMILPVGSPLVQFEVQRAHGDEVNPGDVLLLPVLVWIDRVSIGACRAKCGGREFTVPMGIANPIREAAGMKPYRTDPAVCSSQGRFVE